MISFAKVIFFFELNKHFATFLCKKLTSARFLMAQKTCDDTIRLRLVVQLLPLLVSFIQIGRTIAVPSVTIAPLVANFTQVFSWNAIAVAEEWLFCFEVIIPCP